MSLVVVVVVVVVIFLYLLPSVKDVLGFPPSLRSLQKSNASDSVRSTSCLRMVGWLKSTSEKEPARKIPSNWVRKAAPIQGSRALREEYCVSNPSKVR